MPELVPGKTAARPALGAALASVVWLMLAACTGSSSSMDDMAADTVYVAPPTGDPEVDRPNILAALEQAQPGATIQFAPGTYVIGVNEPTTYISVTVRHIKLVGHPQGTTLRGCDPAVIAPLSCNGLELTGGHQTVLGMTFENFWASLAIGGPGFHCDAPNECAPDGTESVTGGYLIEDNTFRSSVGLYVRGSWLEPSLIRGNRFVNVFHAVSMLGRVIHVLDNDVSVTDPGRVPYFEQPGGAIGSTASSRIRAPSCDDNVIAGNRIEGHPESIIVVLAPPAESCRDNLIRDNVIMDNRLPWSPAVPHAAGAIVLNGRLIENTIVEGNRIIGSEGLGIAVFRSSRNRIVNNTISGVSLRDASRVEERLPQTRSNGSGIWISPGSDENHMSGNTFKDVAAYVIVLEGKGNVVESWNPSDSVHDLGSSNRVTGPDKR